MTPAISIILAYRDRREQFRRTLESYAHWYAQGPQFELVLIDDGSPAEGTAAPVLAEFPWIPVVHRYVERELRNPGALYNQAAQLASAEILFLTNPENLHLGDVLGAALELTRPGRYVCFACRTLMRSGPLADVIAHPERFTYFAEIPGGLYQSSVTSCRLLHFGAAITKQDFLELGGFDPIFDGGQGWEDTDFAERVAARLEVVTVDEPELAHQAHPRHLDMAGHLRNRALFVERWGHGGREFEAYRGKGLRMSGDRTGVLEVGR